MLRSVTTLSGLQMIAPFSSHYGLTSTPKVDVTARIATDFEEKELLDQRYDITYPSVLLKVTYVSYSPG